jgi:hypothetical protein
LRDAAERGIRQGKHGHPADAVDRQIYQTIGGQQAGTAGAGLAASGSPLDLLADSAGQGAFAKDVLAKQGLITEAGYSAWDEALAIMNEHHAVIQSVGSKAALMAKRSSTTALTSGKDGALKRSRGIGD